MISTQPAFQKQIRQQLRQFLTTVEKPIFSPYYFPTHRYLTIAERWRLLGKYMLVPVTTPSSQVAVPEICFVLYSKACERMLLPLLFHLLQRQETQLGRYKIRAIALSGVHELKLNPHAIAHLKKLGCSVETDHYSLLRFCQQPQNKLVVLCLDHRHLSQFHRCGVDIADTLKTFGVKTLSIQHGGTREDAVEGLSTAASDVVLVWGKRVYRQLVETYGVNASRLRLVGNPLHDASAQMLRDSINSSKPQSVLQVLRDRYPYLQKQIETKKIILLASCLHSEYYGYENEQELYQQYIRHIYRSLDFSQVVLLVKMHPLDKKHPNLYQTAAEELIDRNAMAIIEPEVTELDIYKLLLISDLLLTRCSTVAEEALLANKKVVAFDLFPEGPSKGYKHLEEYGRYTTAYAKPKEQLATVISQALFSPPDSTSEHPFHETIVRDITYALDGQSTARAVDTILQELNVGEFRKTSLQRE
ncbi:hypothetical protein [Geitlerinema sp. PCC 9228]|uniref:hypothetical protein n=1 Tax=Geitlerinema sp. PCC 9228 TaxID=111611 RepID=UPI000ADAB5D1|nr:hypothetical protein [Geitlerinema sp. PCC 9228]